MSQQSQSDDKIIQALTSEIGDIEFRDPKTLTPHPKNEEIYGEPEVSDDFRESIARKVWQPLLVTPNGKIISGHRRRKASIQAELPQVPVRVVTFSSESKEIMALVRLNQYRDKTSGIKTAEVMMYREAVESDAETRRLENLKEGTDSPERETFHTRGRATDQLAEMVGITGRTLRKGIEVFDTAAGETDHEEAVINEAQRIKQDMKEGDLSFTAARRELRRKIEEVEVENVEEALTKGANTVEVSQGDIWQLGSHILYCGDTSNEEFRDLIDEEVSFTFADPPYNGTDEDWDGDFEWEHDWIGKQSQISAVTPGTNAIVDFSRRTKMNYQWSIASWTKNGMTRGDLGHANWICIMLFADDDTPLYRNSQDVIRVTIDTSETELTSHKGRKPSELVLKLLTTFTEEKETVVDPFAGSGTTLFVSEETGRRCITGEIDEEFCGGIISRWENNYEPHPKQITAGSL